MNLAPEFEKKIILFCYSFHFPNLCLWLFFPTIVVVVVGHPALTFLLLCNNVIAFVYPCLE